MTKRKWHRCPDCEQAIAPAGALITLNMLVRIAEHVDTQRHRDARALQRAVKGEKQ